MCDNNDSNTILNPPKKKRGRKPKNISNKDPLPVKEKKKRGRKPKNQVFLVNSSNGLKPDINTSTNIEDDDCIIAHLPIKLADINCTNTESVQSENNDIFIKNHKSNNINISEYENKEKKYQNKINELQSIINNLNNKNALKSRNVKISKVKFNYIENNKECWTEKTDICCWWCCHKFDDVPLSLPEKLYNDTFHVFGCFCSFNCAAAYNVNLNDYKIWERLSLLKLLFNKIYNKDTEILPAPPRKTLNIFGGHLNIEEFRSDLINFNKEYLYLIPPMISITPLIEESTRSGIGSGPTSANKTLSVTSNLKYTDKLSRKNPVDNINYSLVKTMGLKKKNKKKEDFFI